MTTITGLTLSDRASFLLDHLDLVQATGIDTARWEHFQVEYLNSDDPFLIAVKSRQIAFSWIIAARAVAEAILENRDTVIVSLSQDEASEKIAYSRQIYNALNLSGLPKVTRDTLTDFEIGKARITSLTGRAPRGRSKASVRLDEFSFIQDSRSIYTSVLPIISKGGGSLHITSSPFGDDNFFAEMYNETIRPYPNFKRMKIPFWEIYAFCTNVRAARLEAPMMITEDVVKKYGNERIKLIFDNMILEDFEQEYCCSFKSSGASWVTFDEIRSAQADDLIYRSALCRNKNISQAIDAIDKLSIDIQTGRIEPILAGGIDIGRKKDTSEIFLVGLGNGGMMPLRLMISLSNVEFEYQQEIISYAMRRLPIVRAMIDQTGLGRNLAENLIKIWPLRIAGVNFTQANKHFFAAELKKGLQTLKIRIPIDRRLAYQLHSVKRVVSGTILKFDAIDDGKDKGHGDCFWALAMAVFAGKQFVMFGNQDATGEGMISYW